MTIGGEFGCLIVLITPLGRVGRRDALGADLSIVSSTDWQGWWLSLFGDYTSSGGLSTRVSSRKMAGIGHRPSN